MTEIQTLFQKIRKLEYPSTMLPVAGEVKRRAFFPGGKGTFDNSEVVSDKSIMLLGQDFDCEDSFVTTCLSTEEDIQKFPTWRNLLTLFEECGIDENDCFYTNAIMGIRKGAGLTGKSPAFKSDTFIKDCQKFFLETIEIQKPRAILVLGPRVAEFLAGTSSQLAAWKKIKSFANLDASEEQVKKDVVFSNGIKSNLAVLVHPSFRFANLRFRSYINKTTKNDAEVLMIKTILNHKA